MRTTVFTAETPRELEGKIHEVISGDLIPTLAIVFCSVAQPLEQIRDVFAQNQIAVFGSTSSGEITNTEFFEERMTVMLIDIPKDTFSVRLFDGKEKSSYRLGQEIASWVNDVYETPALLVLSAGLQADGEALVNGVIESIENDIPFFGGLAGDDLKMQGTYVFTETEIFDMGVLALAIDNSKVEVDGLAVSGWKGIGTIKTITKSDGNVVQMIDDQPALDVYSRYLNINFGDDHTLAAEYPLLVMRDDGSFVLRAAMLINPDKSMVYAGSVPQGSKVQFSVPPSNEIIEFALENLSRFKQNRSGADAVILFSCKGRHLALGPIIEDEIAAIYNLWGVPMTGFFTYGEIGPSGSGRCDFHNNTLTLVTLRER